MTPAMQANIAAPVSRFKSGIVASFAVILFPLPPKSIFYK